VKIIAISGSVREKSYNTALLNAIKKVSSDNIDITLFNEIKHIPIFDPALDENQFPDEINQLISQLRNADAVIISTPEYAHGLTGVIKNLLDWLVPSDALVLKPIMVTSVSTSGLGGLRAHHALVSTLIAMNTQVVVESNMCVPNARIKFDESLNLIDDLTKKRISVSLLALERSVN